MELMSHNSAELLDKVELALDSIRPFLKSDNGDVKVISITPEMIVQVELLGACQTCRMSSMTMKAGVEEAIKNAVPVIRGVEALNAMATA